MQLSEIRIALSTDYIGYLRKHFCHAVVERPHACMRGIAADGFNYRAWHYKNYHVTKTGSHFVGQKGNQIIRVSLVIQY